MEAKIAAGQFFRDFNGGTSASAAQNDAFTVQFTVQKLNLDVYQQAPVLSFGTALPAGTTVIMQTGGGYWYYRAAEGAGAGEQSFSLAAITQPGSYRLLVTVTKGGRQVLAVPYYFIVQ